MTVRAWTYQESISTLEQLYQKPLIPAEKSGLRRVERLLQECGNPHRSFRSVHIAGTTGKGSTTTMIGNILQSAGYRTGYFRSPHLYSYRERMVVDGSEISDGCWEECFSTVWPAADAMIANRLPNYDLGRPSFFEVIFVIAAVYFQRTGIEWGAIETGLGGRLDATNSLQPEVSAITNVSLEHTQVLGDSVQAIAREKAAIIKTGSRAVCGKTDSAALAVIRSRAREVGAPLIEVGPDISYEILQRSLDRQTVRIRSEGLELDANLQLAGDFQAENATVACGIAISLVDRGTQVSKENIVSGLENTRIAGRFETVSRDPLIVLDGAHNPAGVSAATRALRQLLSGKRLIVVFAAMADKDLSTMAETLAPLARCTIVTRAPGSQRSADTATLAQLFKANTDFVVEVPDPADALQRALSMVDNESALFVSGSLYLVGFARFYFKRRGLFS